MAIYSKNIIKQARAWLGKNEADGSHKAIIDVYNAHKPLARGYAVKYTDSWCATFVSAVAIKCGATALIPTECGCDKMIALFKNIGIWEERDNYTPKAGDILFYDWEDSGSGDNTGSANHVGIVEDVKSGTITVIEGNYKDAVGRRTIAVNGKYIRGYGVPKYDKEAVNVAKLDNTPDAWAKDAVEWAVKNGIMKGDANGDYKLRSNITRQELLVMLHNYDKYKK